MACASAVILIIIDGLADTPPPTPLQRARTPTLDLLARRGRCGLIDPVQPGLACGSDTAHLSLFGYDPFEHYRGRGAFEAIGAGVEIAPGDVAFKCNFAWVEDGIVKRRCAQKGMDELGRQLVSELDGIDVDEDVEVRMWHAGGHRCVVRLRGDVSDAVGDTDPLVDGGRLKECVALEEGGVKTARVVNKVSGEICRRLRGNGVSNVVLFRGGSCGIDVEGFEKRHGIGAVMIAPTKIVAGVGVTVGIEVRKVEGGTGGYDTDLGKKVEGVVGGLGGGLGIVHVKAVDEAGHDRDYGRKVEWIERVDEMVKGILERVEEREVVVVVTGDHTTPTVFGDHTCEPVPVLFAGGGVGSDRCERFDEVEAGMYGSLGRFCGLELMGMVRGVLGVGG